MAPNESTILTDYLVTPARLTTIVSLKQFTEFIPRSLQSSPQVRSLYRELQRQRNESVDFVGEEIESEVKQGKVLRREMIRAEREANELDNDEGMDLERALFGQPAGAPYTPQDIGSIIPNLVGAAAAIEAKLSQLQAQETELLKHVQEVISGLSDLRYGRFANSNLREHVLEGLHNVQAVCEPKT